MMLAAIRQAPKHAKGAYAITATVGLPMSKSSTAAGSFAVRWSTAHALAVILAVAALASLRRPELLAWVAALSFVAFLAGSKGEWSPSGRFGLANFVTSARLSITGLLLFAPLGAPPALLGGIAVLILLLDVLDGWIARRLQLAGAFGARFDVESDAFFVMTLSVLLWIRGVTGPWILLAGLWRYVYLLAPIVFPTRAGEAPRSRLGRSIYVVMISCFVSAFVLPPELGVPSAALGTVAVSCSFLRSFWQRYRPAAP